MLVFAKFRKEILAKKIKFLIDETIYLSKECSAIIQRNFPSNLKYIGIFTISCTIIESQKLNGLFVIYKQAST